ncbi:APC membrane recruitment protein 1 [Lepisosteus oculatus]|uniref:APC membrane recruitment protein 1 n=1 Tax=Lepisosteus oculatus TaxID=7918 RepID=UPI00371868A6
MEPSTGSEQTAGTKPLSGGCEETASGSSALELEADKPSEPVEGGAPEQQPPGKLKKTAFKLFGGRKSICTLPSFFGGRNKGHGKVSSKKGMSKSKTHDCITEVSWEDGKRAGDVPAGDFEYHCQKSLTVRMLTSSQSAHLVNDPCKRPEFPNVDTSLSPNSEFCDGKLSTDKSSSFPRPKRGLKGLFSSIRRHKKNKAVDSEKSNTTEVSGENLKDSLAARQSSTSKLETECQDCSAGTNLPVMQNSRETLIGMPECAEDYIVLENSVAKGDTDHTEPFNEDQIVKNVEHAQAEIAEILNVGGTTQCTDSKVTCSPDVNPDCIDNDPPSVNSSDQISLIFGDVASLKSFDSLTGCGDIIADQDDDSVAESTISGERNRNAGKRSSCYVTYQGGGEEMATPDEVDENYLHDVWDNEAAADVCYTPSQQPNLMEHDTNLQMIPEAPAIPCPHLDGSANPSFLRAVVETTHSSGDILTPQSDQQESVPNSDEGYYDSTTPGPDDDGGDSLSQIRKDRLPRDSYSGDALYELYEPDDSLMSPPLEDELSFETQPPTPEALEFLGLTLQSTGSKLYQGFPIKAGLMETEEARLAKIQQEIICHELQGMKKSCIKDQVALSKSRFYTDKSIIECIPKLNKKHQASLKGEQVVPQMQIRTAKGILPESSNIIEISRSNQMCPYNGDLHNQKVIGRPPLDVNPTAGIIGTQLLTNSHQLKDQDPYSEHGNRRCIQSENKESICSSSSSKSEPEYDQAVCFSQALVDFTKHSSFFSNLTEGLGGADSGSSFAQNVQVLPAMVTFDVVDMENEGECDRQMDMVTDEDISSPFEAYDESYLQKDAFAECDDRMFEFYEQSSFLSNSWGVASLPRHLSLSRVSPPMPSPLSLNRRSRSLDTDSLEFDLGDVYPVQSRDSTQFIPVSRSEWDSRKASSLYWSSEKKRNGQSSSSELRQNASAIRSRQQEPACSIKMPVAEEKRIGHAQSFSSIEMEQLKPANGQKDIQLRGCSQNPKNNLWISKRMSQEKGACNPILLSPRQMARPSHLSLQSGDCPSHLKSNSTGTFCKNNAHVTPLDDRREAYFSCKPRLMQFPEVSHQPTKIKPVGITQGVPHFCSATNETLKPAHSEEQQEFTSKGRNELEMVVPVGCNNNTT